MRAVSCPRAEQRDVACTARAKGESSRGSAERERELKLQAEASDTPVRAVS